MKRTVFVMLLALMTVMLAVSVCAASELSTAKDIIDLMNGTYSLAGNYVLKNDIDMDDYNGNLAQKPIGSKDQPFTGTFDGAGYTIRNIDIVDTKGYCGFFGKVSGAKIKNLTVDGSIESNKYFVGGLVGMAGDKSNTTTLIENCVNFCTVKQHTNTATAVAGGIVGIIRASGCANVEVTVKNCINYGAIEAHKQASGIVARILEDADSSGGSYTITGCSNYGTITVADTQDTASGILGCALLYNSETKIENCYNGATASIVGGFRVGGIAGVTYTYTKSTTVTVDTCVNMAAVAAKLPASVKDPDSVNAGGILGAAGTSKASSTGKTVVKNCFNAGDVSLNEDYASQGGMIVGDFYAAAAVDYSAGNCYYEKAKLTEGGNTYVKTTVKNLLNMAHYPASFVGVFLFTEDGPVTMESHPEELIALDDGACVCSICGKELLQVDADGYIEISDKDDLLLLMKNASLGNTGALGYNYKLTANIDLASAAGQHPIGDIRIPFTGVFDGNGKTVSGVKIETSGFSAGFFGHASGATIKDLTVDGEIKASGMIATSSTRVGTGAGGIVGTVGAVAKKTTTIENCVNHCTVTVSGALARAGGIVGAIVRNGQANINITVTNCVNYGKISGTKHAGGIVGRQEDYKEGASGNTLVENCINYGDVAVATSTADSDAAGGILGCSLAYGSKTEIKNCYNFGDITGGYRIGGIVGIVYNYTDASAVTVDSCVNTGAVSASYNNDTNSAGGILGTGAYSAKTTLGTVTVQNCFNGGNVTTIASRAANSGMIVGLVVSGLEDTITYLDSNNYYAKAATITEGGNTNGGEAIVAAQWCMEQGFTFTDAAETERDHLWKNDSAEATCLFCGTTRHAAHAGAMKQVNAPATCVSVSIAYDLCETCYLRENEVIGTALDPDNHALAWEIGEDSAALVCTRDPEKCTHKEDMSAYTTLYVSETGSDSALGLTADTALKSFTLAQKIASKLDQDMTVRLIGTVTLTKNKVSANNTTSKSYEEFPHAYKLTVSSADAEDKATLVVPKSVMYYYLYGPTTFEHIKITGSDAGSKSNLDTSVRFYARGFALTMGEGVEMKDVSGKLSVSASNSTFGLSNTVEISDANVAVYGGFSANGFYDGVTEDTVTSGESTTNLTVLSGSYHAIVGGNSVASGKKFSMENKTVNMTIGAVTVRHILPFTTGGNFGGDVTLTNCTANVHLTGKFSAADVFRVVYDSSAKSSDTTVNYFFHAGAAGFKTGEFPMASRAAEASFNVYYATGLEDDKLINTLYDKSVYYWNDYPTQGEKLNFVEWCAKYSVHDFADGTCTFCGVKQCTGTNHYIAWDADGNGKCIAGCDHTVSIADYSGIYVSDKGKDGASGTEGDPIRSYTLAQRLAAKANKSFTIYLVDTVTLEMSKTSATNTVYRSFEETPHTKSIKVTKGGSAKATLVIPYSVRNYFLSGPVTFTNIRISGDNPTGAVRFFARGNNLTMGSGLEMVNISGGDALTVSKTNSGIEGFGATVTIPNSKVYVFGGFLHGDGTDGLQDGGESPTAFSSYLSITSGKYWAICGGSYSDSADVNPVELDGATIRIGMSSFTARYLAPVNLNGKCSIDNTTVKVEYKGTAKVAEAHRFTYSNLATGGGNTVDHFFYKGMKASEFGDFISGSPNTGVAVNFYYATSLKENPLTLGFIYKSEKYGEAYGQTGDSMTFPEWCVEYGGGHTLQDGVCTFCDIVPCTVHKTEWTVMAPATCTATGLEANRCTVCFEHIEEREIAIDANAHDASWTYGENSAAYVCALCGETVETVTYAEIAASGEVHLSAAGSAGGDGSATAPTNDFALAMQIAAAADRDVTVYIHDVATIFDNGNNTTLLDYIEPAHDNVITITSYGEDRAVLRFDDVTFRIMSYNLSGPTVFKNIEFSTWNNDKALYIVARHNKLEIGEGVSIDYQRKGGNSHSSAVYVVGGCYGTQNSENCGEGADVTIRSGSYSYIYGGTLTGECCTTGDIKLHLLGDITVRNSIIAGNSGNKDHNGDSEDIYITVDGHVTVGKMFAFTSSGANGDGVAYTSQKVTLKIYGGTIMTESFRYGNREAVRAIGAAAEGETATDRLDSLMIYINPADNAAKTMRSFLLDSLRAPVDLVITEEEETEDPEGSDEESGDGSEDENENGDGGSSGIQTGRTAVADPNKYKVLALDESYCEVNNGAHTPLGAAIEHQDPTCVAEGYDIYICSACNEEYSASIDMADHVYGEAITIAATCIAPEMEREVCTACGSVKQVGS